jgi:hypothetical protein
MAQQKHDMEIKVQETTLKALEGQAIADMAKAAKTQAEMSNITVENDIAYAKIAATTIDPEDDVAKEFKMKMEVLDNIRKDRELNIKEEESKLQVELLRKEGQEEEVNQAAMAQFMSEGSDTEIQQ